VQQAQRKGIAARALLSASGLFWSAAFGLALLALGAWFTQLVEGLFARTPALGWLGLALLVVAALALLVMLARELRGVLRQRRIATLHGSIAQAREADDREAARSLMRELVGLYESRPETAGARAHVSSLTREIVDGRDLIDIAERTLLHPLDALVAKEIADAAKRVSVVTAISPRAIVDLLFVAAQAARLVRTIAEIYGGRPGAFGFLRILRSVGAHLAITGGMAVGDSLVQQLLGHGLAARLSARLGEGVLNGLLTARVGLSAMAVCRPAPFAADKPPGIGDVAPFLFGSKKEGTES
jgi:putative membrane protein